MPIRPHTNTQDETHTNETNKNINLENVVKLKATITKTVCISQQCCIIYIRQYMKDNIM